MHDWLAECLESNFYCPTILALVRAAQSIAYLFGCFDEETLI